VASANTGLNPVAKGEKCRTRAFGVPAGQKEKINTVQFVRKEGSEPGGRGKTRMM